MNVCFTDVGVRSFISVAEYISFVSSTEVLPDRRAVRVGNGGNFPPQFGKLHQKISG